MKNNSGNTLKLGLFVFIGLTLFVAAIYFVGKQKNIFGSTFRLQAIFKSVSGLKVGNNVQFAGIHIGTIDEITLISDSTVKVDMVIEKDQQHYIKADAMASIGTEGLMGDKVLVISPGKINQQVVKDNDLIGSKAAVEMDELMVSLKSSLDHINIITYELSVFSGKLNNQDGALTQFMNDKKLYSTLTNTLGGLESSVGSIRTFSNKLNNGNGTLAKLVNDEGMSRSLDSTMNNLELASKSLYENLEAAQSSFLLRGYFKKKKKSEDKLNDEIETHDSLWVPVPEQK